jgi:beta-mannosidase
LRRAFAPRNLIFATEDGILSVVLINDADEPWRGELALSHEQLDGGVRATVTVLVNVEPRTATPIALPDALSHPQDRTAEIVVARIDDLTRVYTFVEDIELALEADPLDVQVEQTHDGYAVSATARTLALDITLLADRAAADATVDDGLVTLTAGHTATFRVRTKARELQETLDRPPVLRTANDLQHTRTGVRRS